MDLSINGLAGVEILYNPYQGLKHLTKLSANYLEGVEILYNPYQGLKLVSAGKKKLTVESRNPL